VIKQRKEAGYSFLSLGFCLCISSRLLYFFHEKPFVLLSSATGPGYGLVVDVSIVSKLEINETFYPKRSASHTMRLAALGSLPCGSLLLFLCAAAILPFSWPFSEVVLGPLFLA
jgi:hypothetical protein